MDRNNRTLGNWVPRVNNTFRPHNDGFNVEQFSSPTPESPGALHIHHEIPDFWNRTDPSPSPPAFQEASYARSPSPSARHYYGGHDRSEVQRSGFPTRSSSHTPSHVECERSGYNTRWDHLEVSGLHHPINLDQHSSRLPRPASPDERTPQYHVVSRNENTTRNGFGWRLRPVSELPDRFRGVFKFGVFNAIQSACFDQVISGWFRDLYIVQDPLTPASAHWKWKDCPLRAEHDSNADTNRE
ncbi:hypothetical protein J3R82DRAFT_5841 [Butyriboletus roseoflavus]|nr:hypothetical protein J3R82DRAFT_5841 [Butyriboletus roseoflavus]